LGLSHIRDTLKRHGLRLSRELGQNFLVEDGLAERLAQLAGVQPGDAVIEVGTGLGTLTRALASRAERVVSIEFDAGLVRALRADALLPGNVELVHADALSLDLAELAGSLAQRNSGDTATARPVHVVANLPYSAATPLLRRLLELRGLLVDWSVMLQRELADRLVAPTGTREYGSLTVLHRLVVDASRELDLKPGCFFPVPGVESSFVRLFPRGEGPLSSDELGRVETVIRAVFNQRRKTILNGLRGGGLPQSGDSEALLAALGSAGIDSRERAEKVEPEQLLALSRALEAGSGAP
jgi:16S rRNA (adenine1518-N6/adenine1519-N6)-dimethyltransferase